MRKYAYRLSAAVLAFSLGIATFHVPRALGTAFSTTHFSGNNRPYSVLEGSTVRIKPYDATFQVPEAWLNHEALAERGQNLYLSRKELDAIYWNKGGDEEEAQVINSVVPFEDCAAHVGDRDWGNYFWNDLQGRVYIADLTPEEITMRIKWRGLPEAQSVFEDAFVVHDDDAEWHKISFRIVDAPTHFVLIKDLDFYYRPIGEKTVVFVFWHAGGFQPTIDGILNSFEPGPSLHDAKEFHVQ